ncbi:MAG: hypothetical protein WC769_08095 [Thermodesulfovibrionales bacterium]
MERAVRKIVVGLIVLCLINTSAFAEGPSAWLNVNYTDTKQYEDGKKTGSSDSLFQNYYFRLGKPLTPLFSYQLYLRTTLNNSHAVDSAGNRTNAYLRAAEPSIDFFLHNPLYKFDIGSRYLEQWSTAKLSDEGRKTTEYYYSRLNIQPYLFPSLSFLADLQKDYDHLSQRKIDATNIKYSGSSWYDLNYKAIRLSYNITYNRNELKTPVSTTTKSISNNFNASYSLGFNKSCLGNNFNLSAGYQGNYGRNNNEQFAPAGSEINTKRGLREGLYAAGSQTEHYADTLGPANSLIDMNYNTPAAVPSGTINIGGNGVKYHNMGIHSASNEAVNKIYIYVNKDVRNDTNLKGTMTDLEVYGSNFNTTGTWTKIDIQPAEVEVYDALNNIYRYIIKFSTSQTASYFRIVNLATASINDVFVTELEAYGTDIVSKTGKLTDVTTFLSQGINLTTSIKPIRTVVLSMNYFLNRSDQGPDSIIGSTGGAFANIFSDPKIEKDKDFIVNLTRSYGGNINWQTHRLLTTMLRYQRNESLDNMDKTNIKSNTYSLSFSSSPLKTLDAVLSLIRTYSFSFNEKQSINNLYMLTIGAKLHRDVNMITDIGYTQTRTYALEDQPAATSATGEGSHSNVRYIRGALDARLTQRLSANLNYGLSNTSGSASSNFKDGSFILTYRPGRFFSISGTLRVSDTDGKMDSTEGILIDWLYLPTVRINANYRHGVTESGTTRTTDVLSGYFIWYVTKFLEFQFNYNYNLENEDIRKEIYNLGGNITCRFW